MDISLKERQAFENYISGIIADKIPSEEIEFIKLLKEDIFTAELFNASNKSIKDFSKILENKLFASIENAFKKFPEFRDDIKYFNWLSEINGLIFSDVARSNDSTAEKLEDGLLELRILYPKYFDNPIFENSLAFVRRLKEKNNQKRNRKSYENVFLKWNDRKIDVLTAISIEINIRKLTRKSNAFSDVFIEQKKIKWHKEHFRLLAYLLFLLKKYEFIYVEGAKNNKGYQMIASRLFTYYSGQIREEKYFTKTIYHDKKKYPEVHARSMIQAKSIIDSAILSMSEK